MPSFDGVLQLFGAGRGFAAGTAVDHRYLFSAHAQGDARGVHGGVSGADHGHALAHAYGRIVERLLVAAHEVDAGEEFVGRENAVEGFAGNAHELGRARAGPTNTAP